MAELQVATVALVGGLQDSKASPEPSDLTTLSNMVPLRGRFALRAPLVETAQLYSLIADEGGSGAAVDEVLGLCFHLGFLYVAAWRHGSIHKVYLYKLNTNGTPVSGTSPVQPIASIWSSVSVKPHVTICAAQGGSAAVSVDRLYFSDADLQLNTVYWNGTAIVPVVQDLDDDNTEEALRFGMVFPYQYHLWGTGYYDGLNPDRPEILRFSRPGLIAETEPDTTFNTEREWWSVDQRPVGKRGDPYTAYGYAGGSLILFKRRETYALYGYDSESWAIKFLSGNVGAVGAKAACWTEDGLCFFWSDRGPHVVDGQNPPTDIGGDIRGLILSLPYSREVEAAYSPDDGLVYFTVPAEGAGDESASVVHLVFDKKEKRWARGQWLAHGAGALAVGAMALIPAETLPEPAAVPTLVSATALSDTTVRLVWTNGDTAPGTTTEVYRHTTTFTPPGTGTLVTTVASGVTTADDTTCPASKTTYYFRVLHVRSSVRSVPSNELSAKTWLKEPTALVATGDAAGIHLAFSNNEDGADILLYRKSSGAYALLDTMVGQAAGALAYEDNSGTLGIVYTYRLAAQKAGETTSEYSNEDAAWALPALIGVNHAATVGGSCPMVCNLRVDWTATGGKTGDVVTLSIKEDGGAYGEKATAVPLAAGAYTSLWFLRKSGGISRALQAKVELYDGGVTLVATMESTASNEMVDATPCNEV
jgi:hypothetical protein